MYGGTADATVIILHVTVSASLSLRSYSSTKLHLTIAFGVCCRAVSPASAVRRLNFTPTVPYPHSHDWQASCGVCIWLPRLTASPLLPPGSGSHPGAVKLCSLTGLLGNGKTEAAVRVSSMEKDQAAQGADRGSSFIPGPLGTSSSVPPHGTSSQD